jgi:LuxR family transcriptional regulator, maltose regulon positive regulatory protein
MQAEIDSRRLRPPGLPKVPGRRGGARARGRRAPPHATLDVVQAKLRPPTLRQGLVARPALVNRLRREAAPVVSVVAPAGYGKTTLLAQWAAAEARPVAWLSIDARDNDPVVLLRHAAAALGLEGAGKPTADRAARALATRRPFLFVVDNADLLRVPEACRLLSLLIARAPNGSTVALAARTVPKPAVAAIRTGALVREVETGDLKLSSGEARALLEAANPELTEDEAADLTGLCEGWPAALYLASLSLRDGATKPRQSSFGGSDRYLADYMRAEFLSQLRPRDVRFLRRTAILDELTGPLCDSVLREEGSDLALKRFARIDLVVPTADGRAPYRLHQLFRDLLMRELLEEEPQLIALLHRRAAAWYQKVGEPESALQHAAAAGDADRVASIIAAVALRASSRSRVAELEHSIERFDESEQLDRYPGVAVHGSRIHAFHGRAAEAERWLEVAERGARRRNRDAAALRPGVAIVRAALCRQGPQRMLADAGAALAGLSRRSQWYQEALLMQGSAAALLGDGDEADALLTAAAAAAQAVGCAETQMLAASQQSLLAREQGDENRADALASEARALAAAPELEGCPTSAIALAAAARAALARGGGVEARGLTTAALELAPLVTEALPWLAVATRLELARCSLLLGDGQTAAGLLAEIRALLEVRPLLGVLVDRARKLQYEVETLARCEAAPAGLTPAELRLLPLLATHLTFREIAAELQVSRNTVKTQAISIYRKLGVSGRSEAIAAAAALDLQGAA